MSVRDHYAVVGHPVAHSRSPRIHALFAQQTGEDLVYRALDVEPGCLPVAVRAFATAGGRGLNVTVPFKEEAWEIADRRSARADRAGAANTLCLHEDGEIFADNTDGAGLVRDLVDNLHLTLRGARVLVLGAGGAVRGVLGPLLDQGPARLRIANRTAARALELARRFAGGVPVVGGGFEDIGAETFDLVINGTAASLHGALPPLPAGLLRPGAWAYDLMYGDEPTPFLRWAQQAGAAGTADGLGMLVEQAAEAFALWRGIRPRTGPVIEALRGR